MPWADGDISEVAVLAQLARMQAAACASLSATAQEAAALLEDPSMLRPSLSLSGTASGLAELATDTEVFRLLSADDHAGRPWRHVGYTPGQFDRARVDQRDNDDEEERQWVSAEMLRQASNAWSQAVEILRSAVIAAERLDESAWDRVRRSASRHRVPAAALYRQPPDHFSHRGDLGIAPAGWTVRPVTRRESTCAYPDCHGRALDGPSSYCLSCLAYRSPDKARQLLMERAGRSIDLRGAAISIQFVELFRDLVAGDFHAELDLRWTRWPHFADFSELVLHGPLLMQHAVVPSWVSFHGTAFTDADFSDAWLGAYVSFANATFEGTTSFARSAFDSTCTFADAVATGPVDLSGTNEAFDFGNLRGSTAARVVGSRVV